MIDLSVALLYLNISSISNKLLIEKVAA